MDADDGGDPGEREARASRRPWSPLLRATVVTAVGWPFALAWFWLVRWVLGEEWRWQHEILHALFLLFVTSLVLSILERRRRRRGDGLRPPPGQN